MSILLACGREGLLTLEDGWRKVACPLSCASLMAVEGGQIAVVDDEAHELWLGSRRVIPVDKGIEAIHLWRGRWLILSGDTDCVTLLDVQSGAPLTLSPAGVYPQEFCLIPGCDTAAVCGGADGCVRLMQLPDLQPVQLIRFPGHVQRIAFYGGWLYVLCAAEEDGLRCLVCRARLTSERYEPLCVLPGLPGSVWVREDGLWIAASEGLYHMPHGATVPDRTLWGHGLIRAMDRRMNQLLLSDPVMGTLSLLDVRGRAAPLTLYEGDVRQGAFVTNPIG